MNDIDEIVDRSKNDNKEKENSNEKSWKIEDKFKKLTGKQLIVIAAVVCVCLIALISAIVYEINKFKISDYIIISYSGASGYASAQCSVDEEKLYSELAGKNTDEEQLEKIRRLIASMEVFVEEDDISNGDKITVNITYNEAIADAVGADFGKGAYKTNAKGVAAGTKISLFDGIEVYFAGMSPEAYVKITNNWEDEYLRSIKFEADKTGNIALNDKIIVTCGVSIEDLGKNGYIAEVLSAEYIADKLSIYANSVEQIDKEIISQMENEASVAIADQTADTSFRMLYRATKDSSFLHSINNETAENIKLISKYFMTKKNSLQGGANNYIYLVYSADIINAEITLPVYFVFEYPQGYMTVDNRFDIQHDNVNSRYRCSADYESLFSEIIESKSENYNVEEIE